jgi:hypothetical protein
MALIAPIMKAARTSETLVSLYQTTGFNNPEGSHLKGIVLLSEWRRNNFICVLEVSVPIQCKNLFLFVTSIA